MDTETDDPNALHIMDFIRDFSDKIGAELESSQGGEKELVRLETDSGCVVEIVREENKDFFRVRGEV